MKYYIQAWAATALLICTACAPAEQEPPQAGFVLPIGQSLSAEGLSAEIGVYTASSTPQLEGILETIDLRDSGGKLFADIDVKALPGQKLVRIYLSHAQAGALLWVGEWEVTIAVGASATLGNFIQMASEGDGSQFEGDAHPRLIGNPEPFGPEGQSNISQICTPANNTCQDEVAVMCSSNGFGFDEEDCAAAEVEHGSGTCENAECVLDCNGDYYEQGGVCYTECGDGIVNNDAGEACDDEGESALCNENCTLSLCGDSVQNVSANEDCDDGNAITETCDYGEPSCTVCSAACENVAGVTSYCGDDAVNGSETCDDGNTDTETTCPYGTQTCVACSSDCTTELSLAGPYCGDGETNGAEACDDGDNLDNTCSADCSENLVEDCAGVWGGSAVLDDCGVCDTDPNNNCVSCDTDGECPAGNHCDDGVCMLDAVNGLACDESSDCQSGHCTDGVCCDGACGNTCESCVSANTGVSDGMCSSVLAGEDPYSDCSDQGAASCGTSGACNGAGYCAFYPAETLCAAPGCEGGNVLGESFCNGIGSCDAGTLTSCSNGCSSGECISEAYIPGAPCADGQIYGQDCWPIMPSNITTCYNGSEEVACPGKAGNGTDACATTGFCGQDGQYADRHTASYTCLNAAGESLDSCPESSSSGEMVQDNLTGLIWQRADLPNDRSWQDAIDYCNSLDDYGGHSDWRLPYPHELQSIMDDSKYSPQVNTGVFPDIASGGYWTLVSSLFNSGGAWNVNFNVGTIGYPNKAYSRSVLCVRGDEPSLPNHFTESTVYSDAIVTDSLTGLVWQKTATTDKTWEEALAYCEASTAAGTGDWRLPTKKELTSLVDFSTSSPASEFPDISSSTTYFWSATTYKGTITKAWSTRFSDGQTYYSTKSESQPALCVRSPLRDNSNGTITDSAKGITWMKCAQGMTFNAESNTCEGSNSTFQYCDAQDNSCNGGVSGGLLDGGGNSSAWETCNTSEFAGHTDWRVPTREELGGLIQCSNGHVVDGVHPAQCSNGDGDFTTPVIDTSLFTNFPNTGFWTSASGADNSNGAWIVFFLYGYIPIDGKDGGRSVLCVR